jgi:hypothetical protein
MYKVTIRLRDANGEVLGTAQHAALYREPRVQVGEKWYRVIGEAEGPQTQTLYVVEE